MHIFSFLCIHYIYIYINILFYILYVVIDMHYVNTIFCLNSLVLKNCVGQSNIPILRVCYNYCLRALNFESLSWFQRLHATNSTVGKCWKPLVSSKTHRIHVWYMIYVPFSTYIWLILNVSLWVYRYIKTIHGSCGKNKQTFFSSQLS